MIMVYTIENFHKSCWCSMHSMPSDFSDKQAKISLVLNFKILSYLRTLQNILCLRKMCFTVSRALNKFGFNDRQEQRKFTDTGTNLLH